VSACVTLEALLDYWAGELPARDADELEAHVFGCDSCTARLAGVAELATAVAQLVRRRGGLQLVLTESLVKQLAAHGLRMRHYRVGPGDRVPCTVGAEDDLLVTYLRADLAEVERVDVLLGDPEHALRLSDVPIDRATGQVVFTVSGDAVRQWPDRVQRVELLAIEDSGERSLGEYAFEHTRPALPLK